MHCRTVKGVDASGEWTLQACPTPDHEPAQTTVSAGSQTLQLHDVIVNVDAVLSATAQSKWACYKLGMRTASAANAEATLSTEVRPGTAAHMVKARPLVILHP